MNPEIKTTEYISKLKDLKLSESARTRIKNNLHEYAAFHVVREGDTGRSIGVVRSDASLYSFKFASMPFVLLLAILLGGGTSLAAQSTLPGDFLYPVKTGVTENVRKALAISADSEAKLQATLLDERIEEAQKLQAQGRLTSETAVAVAANISAQSNRANAAADVSSESVQVETKTKIALALQNFLATTNVNTNTDTDLDTKLAAETPTTTEAAMSTSIATAKMSSDVATGLYDITAYKKDMNARTKALRELVTKYQVDLKASVSADMIIKIDAAAKFIADAETQTEDDARATLDKASELVGEVEAKLSTLGQVEIDGDTGIITDIDFSIDPMIIDRGDGSGDGIPTDPRAAQ